MTKRIFTLLTSLFFVLSFNLYAAAPVFSAPSCWLTFPGRRDTVSGPNFYEGCGNAPSEIINKFLPPIFSILGFITVIMIVISAIQFISSSGNPESAAAARGRLTYAIVGFVIIVLSYVILQIVNNLFLGTGVAN